MTASGGTAFRACGPTQTSLPYKGRKEGNTDAGPAAPGRQPPSRCGVSRSAWGAPWPLSGTEGVKDVTRVANLKPKEGRRKGVGGFGVRQGSILRFGMGLPSATVGGHEKQGAR